jgi:hypothetical protein
MWQAKVHCVVKKWAKDKSNVGVVGQANNQTLALGFAHEQRCVRMIFEGAFIREVK